MELSFEFFPPKTPAGAVNLQTTAKTLAALRPLYYSVTFGAGGSKQNATIETVIEMHQKNAVKVAPHISCTNTKKTQIRKMLANYQNLGIDRLVAIRGDIPKTGKNNGDFRHTNELVAFIRQNFKNHFHIEVAAYPDTHPEAENFDADIARLAAKIRAGANGAITQYFYHPAAYFRLCDELAKIGVDAPITPGIMPITNYHGLVRFSKLCGAEIPQWIKKRLAFYQNDEPSLRAFGIDVVVDLCEKLTAGGVRAFHFYTLNKAEPALTIAKAMI